LTFTDPSGPRVVLQAPVNGGIGWLALQTPREILQASTLSEVRSTLRQVQTAADAGLFAAGFVGYEAAPAFDPALRTHAPGGQPLAWFGIFQEAEILDGLAPSSTSESTLPWQASITPDRYKQAIADILRHIAQGDTYQVNLTLRLTSPFTGDPWALFHSLCRGQRSECCAYVDTGDWVLCSASPELFFQLDGERIWSRPMKGTAPRGRTADEDSRQGRWLKSSVKNRAENVMIVDMVRNDLGRIAVPNSVAVAELWRLEKYPSLFQLTSTVEARTEASVEEIFAALFPCASVTGAPKIRAMEIIHELEQSPRGVYTGAIGMIGPGRQARFNVGIRTVQVDRAAGRATYGTGGGIVWDSVADSEWQECRTKALVLRPPPPQFELLETMLWDPEEGILLLERHLDRLRDSASYFDFPFDSELASAELAAVAKQLPGSPHRLRLLVKTDGVRRIEAAPLKEDDRPWRLAVAAGPVDSSDPFLFHKTTHRDVYEQHRLAYPDHDDVLLWNEKREITESTLANIVVRHGDGLVTPPVDCGLLAGTYRAELLARGEISEKRIRIQDLAAVDEVYLINSVRRWIRTELDPADLALVP